MTRIILQTRDGQEVILSAQNNDNVMETIRDGGGDELLALCGGCCSCATCHVYVEDAFLAKLPQMSELENDLLDATSHRTANSRLSCQLMVNDALSGMRVTIAPED